MRDDDIASWVDSVSTNRSSPVAPRGQKRKRLQEHCPNAWQVQRPTPPKSSTSSLPVKLDIQTNTTTMALPNKRARHQAENEDDEDHADELGMDMLDLHTTPRPTRPRGRLQRTQSVGSRPSTSTSATGTSRRSGASSPRKMMTTMAIADHPIVERAMEDETAQMPKELEELCGLLSDVSDGKGILPKTMKGKIAAYSDPRISRLKARDWYFSDYRDDLGRTPDLHRVTQIIRVSAECARPEHGENVWNEEMHRLVLCEAFREPNIGPFVHSFDFLPCQSARIDRQYLRLSLPEKLVDYAVCFDLEKGIDGSHTQSSQFPFPDLGAINRIRDLCRQMSNPAINHTWNLMNRPLVLSIETKRPGEGFDKAVLQISAWQTAQWNKLLHLIALTQDKDVDSLTGEDEADLLHGLPFLPGIIIQGNEWYFVATTREGRTTVLWKRQYIGSSNTVDGVYKIVTALQYLRQWSYQTYWPWFRRTVLGLSS